MTSQRAEDSLTGSPSPPPLPPPPPTPPRSSRRIMFRMPAFDDAEDVYRYRPGGHHPVNLGDVIERRFKIIHKLGNGGFALVWLARDLDQDRYVALKILKSDASTQGTEEVKILEYLKNTAGKDRITNLHETFTIRGPNGFHQCLVLEFGGPSLQRLTFYCKRPPLPFLKAAARSLAEGVAALHEAGVCHGGQYSPRMTTELTPTYLNLDLTYSNVLFEIADFQNWTEDEVYRYLGPPKTDPLLQLDGTPAPAFAPAHVVDALDYSHLNMEYLSSSILITDFGEAFFKDNAPKGLGAPATFSAPELLFGYQPSCAIDLWALGCLIFQIHTLRVLIPTVFGSYEESVALAIETIGALPEPWRESFYDKEKPLVDIPGRKHRWFDNRLERTRSLGSQVLKELPEISQDQHNTLVQLLEGILVFEPSHRLSAAEIVVNPWFV